MNEVIEKKLKLIFGESTGVQTAERLEGLIDQWRNQNPQVSVSSTGGLPADQKDAIMITYGDNIQKSGMNHLEALKNFSQRRLTGVVSGIHILPFSPYSSDDGFSVIDYRAVNPEWGNWDQITSIAGNFRLMADLVLNHCSAHSFWFKEFLAGVEKYEDYFITVNPGTDLSGVFRPRALPLTHEFEVNGQKKMVWTTFSQDQVDLNFANPEVFLEFIDILLDYVARGVQLIRLDAVGFLWKEIGTSCMHHPNTHEIIKVFRLVLTETSPEVILITETNVPHEENISYFGQGNDEAHMVYQFTLPPLTLDAFLRGDASRLTAWAATLPEPNSDFSFFNFLASHDGVGLLPARGYLSSREINDLVAEVKTRGARVGYKSTPDGDIPYELNVSYRDAVAEDTLPIDKRAAKFLASQAVMLSLAGIPGIYIHSLLGSGNWDEGVRLTGINRSINREKLDLDKLNAELDDSSSLRGRIFTGYTGMLKARRAHPAFHPAAEQHIHSLSSSVFALTRTADNGQSVLCLISVSSKRQEVHLPGKWSAEKSCMNIINSSLVEVENGKVFMDAWDVFWLEMNR